ncbi:5-dehydro-2-deoxygluconokinase [Streptomyces sp. NPDC051310]|uniref:5-dehydro-2-deoxygluconokinase n=1 Tax=Streptomyces sp. NPDC051310 TaxID=3365649 RepID=UPI0037BC1DE4
MATDPTDPTDPADPYDLITMGRIGVDLYPLQVGVPLARVDAFGKFLGGSAANVAVAAARLGRRSAVITRTGADPFGEYLHQELRAFGVDDRWMTPVEGCPTPLTFCEIFPPDDFPLYFYRFPRAPDLEIHEHELDLAAIAAARVFWMTGTGLSAEPSRTATLAALSHRTRRGTTVFDLDWRPALWKDTAGAGAATARTHYTAALRHATVAVGNLDECEIATGRRAPADAARALLDAGVRLAVVKRGPEGVLAMTADGETVDVPPVPVDVVNGLGAGDAFGGALCHGLLAGWDLERILRYANAAGALVASRLACSSAMPRPDEVTAALDGVRPAAPGPHGAEPHGAEPENVRPEGIRPAHAEPADVPREDVRPEGVGPEGVGPEGVRP